MYTEKRFTQMSVKKIATAKRTFRVTKDNIKKLEHDLRYNSDDIVDDMMKIPNRSTTILKTSETILPINSEE